MSQNDHLGLSQSFLVIFGPWRSQKSQILIALLRTGLRPPKLRECIIIWLTPFVKKKLKPSVRLENTPHWHNPERREFFHLALLRHHHIKTSLNFLEENHWARPFFALFRSFREKLQVTVSLNHPVAI